MAAASLVPPSKTSSIEWLSEKVQALESKVSEMPRRLAGTDLLEKRLEMLEQRTDLLEKIFLFVDIEVLNKAIASTTGHTCGPPALLPACQVPSHLAGKGSFMNHTCGHMHRTLLGSHRSAAVEPQKAVPKRRDSTPPPRLDDAPKAPFGSPICSTASVDSWSALENPMEPIPEPDTTLSSTPSVSPSSAKRKADNEGEPTLVSASDSGSAEVVATLLEGRADPDYRSVDGETALHRAAYWAKKDIVELLLNARAEPSARDRKGKTPMRKSYDNPDIVAALLDAGAGPNDVDESGRTTLHRSAENGHVDVIDVLIKAGANPNIGNMEEETPLHEAANFGQAAALQALLRARGNVDAVDTYGATPLHFAAYGGHACIAKLLVEARADVLKANKDGEVPLKSAEQGKKTEVAVFLRAQGGELVTDSEAEAGKSNKDQKSPSAMSGPSAETKNIAVGSTESAGRT